MDLISGMSPLRLGLLGSDSVAALDRVDLSGEYAVVVYHFKGTPPRGMLFHR